jgi:hypothetical protein
VKVEYAYFLETGLASIVATMKSGTSVEVGVVGNEGIAGIPVLLGTESMPNRNFVQMPASGFRIKAGPLGEAFERPGKLRQKLQRYLPASGSGRRRPQGATACTKSRNDSPAGCCCARTEPNPTICKSPTNL